VVLGMVRDVFEVHAVGVGGDTQCERACAAPIRSRSYRVFPTWHDAKD